MSKEYLEAWNFIKEQMPYFTHSHLFTEMRENSDIVDNALQRLEAINNANPSEALNYLDQFINEMTKCLENPKQYVKDYDKEIFYKYKYTFETTIKQALLKAQEQEKVLEIIFEKNVDIKQLKHYIEIYSDDIALKTYNDFHSGDEELTEEEFELLKRYFE